MPPTNSRLAYEDHYRLMDRALASPGGVRAKYPDYGAGKRAQLEFYYARKVDRDDNKKMYIDKEHPLHGRSTYDHLRLYLERIEGSPAFWLYIKTVSHRGTEVEELKDAS